MRGYFIFSFGVTSLIGFSLLMFSASNLFYIWLFIEMCSLSLIPLFFLSISLNSSDSLFSFLIISSVSSSFVVSGILFDEMCLLIVFGLLIKFGIFPFFGWVYKVMSNSNWYVVWGLSTLLKSPFFILPLFVVGFGSELVYIFVIISFVVLVFLFWTYTFEWEMCWCHMMLSSSAALLIMSCGQALDVLVWFFVIYLVWASLVIIFMSHQGEFCLLGVGSVFLFVFLLVSLPFSLSVFYKLFLCVCMFSCEVFVFLPWVVYTVSEQFYLLKFLIDTNMSRSSLGAMMFV